MFPKIFFRERRVRTVVQNLSPEELRGGIFLGPCRGHDTVVIFFNIDGFREVDIRLLHKNFGF